MFILLTATIGLVAWALHLMQKAVTRREFSLMLAGFLIVSAAGALLTVYFLVQSSMGSMANMVDVNALSDFDAAYMGLEVLDDWNQPATVPEVAPEILSRVPLD